jgi:hypothetical protein
VAENRRGHIAAWFNGSRKAARSKPINDRVVPLRIVLRRFAKIIFNAC